MKLLFGLLGGSIAGLVGAVAWAGVIYATGYELSILAIGIGMLTGAGVLIGSGRTGGPALGGAAAIIAVGAILLGKWGWVGPFAAARTTMTS